MKLVDYFDLNKGEASFAFADREPAPAVTAKGQRPGFDLSRPAKTTATSFPEQLNEARRLERERELLRQDDKQTVRPPSAKAAPAPAAAGPAPAKETTVVSLAKKSARKAAMSVPEQILMYVGVVIGVFFGNAIKQFNLGKPIALAFTGQLVVISCVVGLVIIPVVFRKLRVQPNTPLVVRVGIFVQNGVFWQTLFSAIGKGM